MIMQRKKRGFRTIAYTTTRPRALVGKSVDADVRRARSSSYIASCDYESAAMDGDKAQMHRIRHAAMVSWLRKMGAYEAAKIPRRVTSP